mmetsp:Transcript_107936/g.348482  ORF Transcript_107936/g.348482 Transcript_107936/m.348482 type:complete len:400 (+) Transcript_107936:1406-2605(+)
MQCSIRRLAGCDHRKAGSPWIRVSCSSSLGGHISRSSSRCKNVGPSMEAALRSPRAWHGGAAPQQPQRGGRDRLQTSRDGCGRAEDPDRGACRRCRIADRRQARFFVAQHALTPRTALRPQRLAPAAAGEHRGALRGAHREGHAVGDAEGLAVVCGQRRFRLGCGARVDLQRPAHVRGSWSLPCGVLSGDCCCVHQRHADVGSSTVALAWHTLGFCCKHRPDGLQPGVLRPARREARKGQLLRRGRRLCCSVLRPRGGVASNISGWHSAGPILQGRGRPRRAPFAERRLGRPLRRDRRRRLAAAGLLCLPGLPGAAVVPCRGRLSVDLPCRAGALLSELEWCHIGAAAVLCLEAPQSEPEKRSLKRTREPSIKALIARSPCNKGLLKGVGRMSGSVLGC